MFLIAIQRSFVFGLQTFWRNIWLSLATIFIICLTLISINFLIMIGGISDTATEIVKDKVDISLHFHQEVKDEKIAEVKSHLETMPQIKKISYRSAEVNLEAFKERHRDDIAIQETLAELEGNPLGATLIIKAKDLDDYPEVLEAIDNPAYANLIEERSYDDHQVAIERINNIAENVKRAGLIVSLVFVLIAILIIFNTVRIAIFTHQDEINIMKLVGANNWFIRSPFIFESIISGVIAVVITSILVYPIMSTLQPFLSDFFGSDSFSIVGYFNDNFIWIFGSQLIGIILLNIIGSILAIRKYLNV